MSIKYRIRTLYATAAELTSDNPVLLEGEWGTEKVTGKRKIGPGAWNSLPYWDPGAAGGAVQDDDPRLSDPREWTAATVDQAEAEAGTATTRRAWTAQRVFQAVAAWWAASAASTKLAGIATGATANSSDAALLDRANHTGTQAASTITMATARLLGRSTASAGAVEEITLGTGLSFTGTTLNAAGGVPIGYTVKTSNYTAVAGDRISADVTGGAFTITLPATPSDAALVEIIPARGTFFTNNLTVGRNGESINGAAADLVLSGTMGATLVYRTGYGWRALADSFAVNELGFPKTGDSKISFRSFRLTASLYNRDVLVSDENGALSWPQGLGALGATNGVALDLGADIRYQGTRITFRSSGFAADIQLSAIAEGVLQLNNRTGGKGILELMQTASGGTPSTNTARIYSKDVSGTAEMFVMDEAGNETQISPHHSSAPATLLDGPFDEIGYTANYYTGLITYTNKQRQIAGRQDAQLVETFSERNARTGESLTQWDWDTVQADQVAKREQERAEWAERKAEWEAKPENTERVFVEAEPEALTAKPQPDALTAQLEGLAEFLAARNAPTPQWTQFGAALAIDPAVNTLVATAAQSAPVLHLMMGVGLGQAAQGDPQTFSVAWSAAVQGGLVNAELVAHMQAMATTYNLPPEFIAGLNPSTPEP